MNKRLKTIKNALANEIRDKGTKIRNAIYSPRGLTTIKIGMVVGVPLAIAGIKIAYALLTGDHSQTANAHEELRLSIEQNPALTNFDYNHNGVIDGNEVGPALDYAKTHDINVYFSASTEPTVANQIIVPKDNDLETIAKYDTNDDGKWDLNEFRSYLNTEHMNDEARGGPDLVEASDANLEKIFGGNYVPYRLE